MISVKAIALAVAAAAEAVVAVNRRGAVAASVPGTPAEAETPVRRNEAAAEAAAEAG